MSRLKYKWEYLKAYFDYINIECLWLFRENERKRAHAYATLMADRKCIFDWTETVVTVDKLTDLGLLQTANMFTNPGMSSSNMSLKTAYRLGHSPIRTQVFWVEMMDIPSFVSVHLVRHHVGVLHFVGSNRDDRSGAHPLDVNRYTPVNHSMLINAEALMNMAHSRLCTKAHKDTRKVMSMIAGKAMEVDPDLGAHLVPMCGYRNGYCEKDCGLAKYHSMGVRAERELNA